MATSEGLFFRFWFLPFFSGVSSSVQDAAHSDGWDPQTALMCVSLEQDQSPLIGQQIRFANIKREGEKKNNSIRISVIKPSLAVFQWCMYILLDYIPRHSPLGWNVAFMSGIFYCGRHCYSSRDSWAALHTHVLPACHYAQDTKVYMQCKLIIMDGVNSISLI